MSAVAAVSDVGTNIFLSRGGIKNPIDHEITIPKYNSRSLSLAFVFLMVVSRSIGFFMPPRLRKQFIPTSLTAATALIPIRP